MNIKQLKKEIRKLGIDERNYNICDRAVYDGCFNILSHDNGKWDIFYGEKGKKKDQQVFDSEDEACSAVLAMIIAGIGTKRLEDKPKYWKHYRKRSLPIQHKMGTFLFIFSVLFGAFFAGYQFYIHEFNFVFWFFIGWMIFFTVLAVCWSNDRTYELFEYIATPIVFGILILGFVAAMIAAPIYIIPQVQAGEIGKDYYISLVFGEIALGAAVWAFYYFFIKDYVDELRDYLRAKKKKDKDT